MDCLGPTALVLQGSLLLNLAFPAIQCHSCMQHSRFLATNVYAHPPQELHGVERIALAVDWWVIDVGLSTTAIRLHSPEAALAPCSSCSRAGRERHCFYRKRKACTVDSSGSEKRRGPRALARTLVSLRNRAPSLKMRTAASLHRIKRAKPNLGPQCTRM